MIIESRDAEYDALVELAKSICVAARTAPKARGVDFTDMVILTGNEKAELSAEMRVIGEKLGDRGKFFLRDADNIDTAQVLILFGVSRNTRGLGEMCGLCGFKDCAATMGAGAMCMFAGIDLGIALGSAASMAASGCADNRIMFTAGMAAKSLGLLEGHPVIMGMPLFSGGKNPFFDR